jgi:hypothetical protein
MLEIREEEQKIYKTNKYFIHVVTPKGREWHLRTRIRWKDKTETDVGAMKCEIMAQDEFSSRMLYDVCCTLYDVCCMLCVVRCMMCVVRCALYVV